MKAEVVIWRVVPREDYQWEKVDDTATIITGSSLVTLEVPMFLETFMSKIDPRKKYIMRLEEI